MPATTAVERWGSDRGHIGALLRWRRLQAGLTREQVMRRGGFGNLAEVAAAEAARSPLPRLLHRYLRALASAELAHG